MEVSTGLECEVHRVKPGRGYYLLYDWVSQKGASDGREHAPGSAQVGLLRDRAACPSRGRPALRPGRAPGSIELGLEGRQASIALPVNGLRRAHRVDRGVSLLLC
jgi:hypothetical protein